MLQVYDPYLTYDRNFGPQYKFTVDYNALLSDGYEYTFNWTHTLRFNYWDHWINQKKLNN